MLFSGAELIKTSGNQVERMERMGKRSVEAVKPVENPGQSQSSLDSDSGKNALLRFAKFIKDANSSPPKRLKKGLPAAYVHQAELTQEHPGSGAMLNIYV
jgi:hypothetical protein